MPGASIFCGHGRSAARHRESREVRSSTFQVASVFAVCQSSNKLSELASLGESPSCRYGLARKSAGGAEVCAGTRVVKRRNATTRMNLSTIHSRPHYFQFDEGEGHIEVFRDRNAAVTFPAYSVSEGLKSCSAVFSWIPPSARFSRSLFRWVLWSSFRWRPLRTQAPARFSRAFSPGSTCPSTVPSRTWTEFPPADRLSSSRTTLSD